MTASSWQNPQINEPFFRSCSVVMLSVAYTFIFLNSDAPLLCCIKVAYFTSWKVFKYGVISGPYFPLFGLNLRIQSEYRKIRTRNNSVFGHFSCIASSNETLEIHFPEIIRVSWNIHFKRHALVENRRVRDHSFSTFTRISEKLIFLSPRGKKCSFSGNILRTY